MKRAGKEMDGLFGDDGSKERAARRMDHLGAKEVGAIGALGWEQPSEIIVAGSRYRDSCLTQSTTAQRPALFHQFDL